MSRMHSASKGRAGSTKPSKPLKPTWVRYEAPEVEMIVGKLAKEGKSMSEIGIIMRDTYGIPSIKLITGKTVSAIIEEKKLSKELPEDLLALLRKVVALRKHFENNRQDMTAKRGVQLTESKINRLVKYYKSTGRLDSKWKYDPKRVSMYL